jgi:DNA invertase Pin-like site-specific DNA recombinase
MTGSKPKPRSVRKPAVVRLDGYIRVSAVGERDVEDESYLTEKMQRSKIESAVGLRDGKIEIVDWVSEPNVSGTKRIRPGLDKILERIRTGETDGIAVAYLSRLSRLGPSDAMKLVEEIHAAGGKVMSVDLGVDPVTMSGELFFTIVLAINRWESRRRGATWRDAIEDASKRGLYITNTTPFGYRRVTEDGDPVTENWKSARLEVDPVEGPIVTEIFRRRAANQSWATIRDWLRSTGTRPQAIRKRQAVEEGGKKRYVTVERPRTARWDVGHIQRIVKKPLYKGVVVNRHKGGGEVTEDIVVEGTVPPLTDPKTWRIAQDARAPRADSYDYGARWGGRSNQSPLLLKGLCRCAGCRYALQTVQNTNQTTGAYSVGYRCAREGCSARAHIAAVYPTGGRTERLGILEGIEPYVVKRFFERLYAIEATAYGANQKLEELEAAVVAARGRLDDYLSDTELEQVVGRQAFLAGARTRQAALDDVQRQLDRETRVAGRPLVDRPVRQLEGDWPDMTVDDQRAHLASVIQTVFVRQGRNEGNGYGASARRVHIVWFDGTMPDVPRQGPGGGKGFPRPFDFADADDPRDLEVTLS